MSRNVTLLTAAVFLIATGIVSASIDYSFLERFHVNFTTLSNEVEFELQQKREFNGLLIREFNREILLEFGIMIPRMRLAHNEFIQYVMNRDAVDDECRTYVLFLADLYMFFQQYDIQDCAYLTHMQLRDDALNRFLPYEHEFSRENSRATFQVIQTLGRNRITDVDAIEFELNDELNYYMGLRQYYTELLEAELAKHGEDAHVTINMLEACIAYAFFWQDDDHEYLRTYLDNDCNF